MHDVTEGDEPGMAERCDAGGGTQERLRLILLTSLTPTGADPEAVRGAPGEPDNKLRGLDVIESADVHIGVECPLGYAKLLEQHVLASPYDDWRECTAFHSMMAFGIGDELRLLASCGADVDREHLLERTGIMLL